MDPFPFFRVTGHYGEVEKIIAKTKKLLPKEEDPKKEAEKQIGYFCNNASRMHYGKFREQVLFAGPGVVEAGCKTMAGKRLKQSGMERSVRGANAIIALLCLPLCLPGTAQADAPPAERRISGSKKRPNLIPLAAL